MNVVVYGVLGFFAFVILSRQQNVSQGTSQRAPTAIAREQSATADTPTELPTNSPAPTITPTPPTSSSSDASSASLTITPSRTATPSKSGGLVLAPTPASQRVAAPTKAAAPPAAPAAPSGDSPSNPLIPGDSWHLLASGASVWYKVGNGGDHMDVFLEANPLDGMTFEVFTPDNLQRPIGQGSLDNTRSRLVWAGGHWNSSGDWLARVNNANPMAVQYKLTSSTRVIGMCDSVSYWEWIGKNLVYWTRCR